MASRSSGGRFAYRVEASQKIFLSLSAGWQPLFTFCRNRTSAKHVLAQNAKYIWTRMNNGESCTLARARARTLWRETLAYKRLVRAHLPTHAKSAAVVSSAGDDSSSNVPFIMSHAKPKTSWRSSFLNTQTRTHALDARSHNSVLLSDKRLFNIKLSDGRRLSHKVMTKDFFHDAVFISHTETRTRRTAALSVTDGNPLSDGA